jgi:hypothetical protein
MRIYLAAMEDRDVYNLCKRGRLATDNILLSYFYIRDRGDYLSPLRKSVSKIMIDSGAHTFFSMSDNRKLTVTKWKKRSKVEIDPNEYFKEYLEWLKENIHNIDYFVELDIGEIVGQPLVNMWRETFKKAGIYDKCMPVYHPDCITRQEFSEMLDDSQSRYVALEGVRSYRQNMKYLEVVKECYQKKVKVHGFAMVREKWLGYVPFASVDSTSWKSGTMFGIFKALDMKGRIKNIHYKNRKELFSIAGKVPITNSLQTRLEYREFLYMESAKAYKQMEIYYTNLWTKRGVVWE